jgi:hypothetical protein
MANIPFSDPISKISASFKQLPPANVLTMTQGNIDLNGNTLTLGTSAALANIGTLVYTSGTIINTGSFIRWFAKGSIATGSSAG